MKIKKIIALLFLIASIVVVQSQPIAFAEAPPGVDSPFGDADEDTGPPSLEGGAADDDDTSPPAEEEDDAADDDTPADDTDVGTADDTDTSADVGAETQNDTSGSENIISESGPGVAFLLIPSLILGYAYKKKKC